MADTHADPDSVGLPEWADSETGTGFHPGACLEGRYKLVGFIAKGGMGEVYAADDLVLGERVALKTIRAEIAGRRLVLARFLRELQLARKVTHPNVCRLFDLGQVDGVQFLTMELLTGETLAERIRRRGALPPKEALAIAQQLAAGLAAAHDAGVLHRDFKSQNVMVTGGGRAVITDFGLARGLGEDDDLSAVGTPSSMAPEQVVGGATTTATDIYALGLVLYEMVTGALPFRGGTPVEVARRRLTEAPPPPRGAGLDTRWSQVIMRCLERAPANRYQRAAEVAAALAPRSRKLLWSSLAAGALAAALAVKLLVGPSVAGPAVVHPSPPTVAVLGFAGSDNDDWIDPALSELMVADLAGTRGLRVVGLDKVTRMREELRLAPSGPYDLARVADDLGCDYVVLGTHDHGHVAVQVLDALDGATIAALSGDGLDGLDDLARRAGDALRSHRGLERGAPRARPLPAIADDIPDYARALAKLRGHDRPGAITLLEATVAREPAFAIGHRTLADTIFGPDPVRAKLEADLAVSLATELPAEDQLEIAQLRSYVHEDFEQTLLFTRQLAALHPDDVEYALAIVDAEIDANRLGEARDSLERANRLARTPLDDILVDLQNAHLADAIGDYRTMQASCARAAAKAAAHGQKLTVLSAHAAEQWALYNLGEPQRAVAVIHDAARINLELGRSDAVVAMADNTATYAVERGDLADGRRQYDEAIAYNRPHGFGAIQGMLGFVFDLEIARGRLDEAEAVLAEINSQGEGARSTYRPWAAGQQLHAAQLRERRGDLAGARTLLESAEAVYREFADNRNLAAVLDLDGRVLFAEGDLAAARRRLEEASAIRVTLGAARTVAESELALAELELEEKNDVVAERLSRQALAELSRQGALDGVAAASTLLAETLLSEGRHDEAAAALVPIAARPSESLDVRGRLRIVVARVAGDASGLDGIIAEARAAGLVELELRARLARVELGATDAALAGDARARGYALIARKAR